jgi:hypothetical protein
LMKLRLKKPRLTQLNWITNCCRRDLVSI